MEEKVGKVGRHDFCVDWRYNARGGAFKATNSSDPLEAVERAIVELKKFAKAADDLIDQETSGEATGEAWEPLSIGDFVSDLEDISRRLRGTNCKQVASNELAELDAIISSMKSTAGKVAGEVTGDTDGYVCSNCGNPVQKGDTHCSGCQQELNWKELQTDHRDENAVGEVVDEPFTCGDCGKPVYTGDSHCSSCGKPLNWEGMKDAGSRLDD